MKPTEPDIIKKAAELRSLQRRYPVAAHPRPCIRSRLLQAERELDTLLLEYFTPQGEMFNPETETANGE